MRGQAGADVNARADSEIRRSRGGATQGDVRRCRRSCAGQDRGQKNGRGETPLISRRARDAGRRDALIRAKADVNARKKQGERPHQAPDGQPDIVKALDAGAEVDAEIPGTRPSTTRRGSSA